MAGASWMTMTFVSAAFVTATVVMIASLQHDIGVRHIGRLERVPHSGRPDEDGKGKRYVLAWYRECGCTGMEIEAVTLLVGVVAMLGDNYVRTNRCENTCIWLHSTRAILDQIEVNEEQLWAASASKIPIAAVIHAAFIGVCGVPPSLPSRDVRHIAIRISRSMFETDSITATGARQCNSNFDAVWVPSKFNQATFKNTGVKNELLKVLPEPFDPSLFNCNAEHMRVNFFTNANFTSDENNNRDDVLHVASRRVVDAISRNNGTFTFLSIFKWEPRKNWKALLSSFWRAFPEAPMHFVQEGGRNITLTVRLVVKTLKLSWGTDPRFDIADLCADLGISQSAADRVLVIDEVLPTATLPHVYRAADAFVLPTHGEGWGLPLLEAMASGLPTIATGWGGQTEFMNAGNSFLLDYRLVASNEDPLQRWAAPDEADLVDAMHQVVRQANVQKKVQNACSEIHGHFTQSVVARQVDELIRGEFFAKKQLGALFLVNPLMKRVDLHSYYIF